MAGVVLLNFSFFLFEGAFRNAAANNLKQTVQTLDPMLRDLAELMNASSYVLSEKVLFAILSHSFCFVF